MTSDTYLSPSMSTPNKHKTLLKVSPVSSDHWSSGKSSSSSSARLKQTKCVVQIVKACQLLASDAETGKSDPVCFMKFTPQGSDALSPPVAIDWDSFESPASGILSTAVIQACTDPIWNSYHTFPLILESYQELLNASIDLRIRDEDVEEDGSTTYDDLGQVRAIRVRRQQPSSIFMKFVLTDVMSFLSLPKGVHSSQRLY